MSNVLAILEWCMSHPALQVRHGYTSCQLEAPPSLSGFWLLPEKLHQESTRHFRVPHRFLDFHHETEDHFGVRQHPISLRL